MTGNCCRFAVDSIEYCMSEEVFPVYFRNMILSDGLSAFALRTGKYRPVNYADTDN